MLKGIFNGLLIFLFVFCALNGTKIANDGINGSFWMSSAILYAIVVLNANVWIAQRTNTHTWVSTFWIVGSILSYFLCYWFENFFTFSGPMYESFDHVMTDNRTYLVLLLSVWQFVSMDVILARWEDYKALKRDKQALQEQIEGGLPFNSLGDRNSLIREPSNVAAGSFVERKRLLGEDG